MVGWLRELLKKPKNPMPKVTKTPTTPKPKVDTKPVEVAPIVDVVVRHFNKNIKISPRKLRLAVTSIKKLSPLEALSRLKFLNSNAGRILVKAVEQVIANAKNKNLNLETLKFKTIIVNEGQKIKRMDKAHGSRFARGIILRRHSRLELLLIGQTNNGSKS